MQKNSFYSVLLVLLLSSLAFANKRIEALHQSAYELLDTNADSAFTLATIALEEAKTNREPYLEAQSLFIQAYVYRMNNNMGESFLANLEALKVLDNLPSKEAISTTLKLLLNTGEILGFHLAFDQAMHYYNRGIELAKQHDEKGRLIKLYFNKASTQQSNLELENGLETIQLALELSNEVGDERMFIRSLNLKGLLLIELGRHDEAEETFYGIVHHNFRSISPDKYIAIAWHNIGHNLASQEKWSLAQEAYLKALPFRSRETDAEGLFSTYLDLTEVNYFQKNYSRADHFGDLAEELFPEADLEPSNYRLFDLRSKIALKQHNSTRAFEYVQRYYQENMRFLEIQAEILKTRSQYKMEILTAGFFNSTTNMEEQSLLEYVIWLSGLMMCGMILLYRVKNWYVKKSIIKELAKIDSESIV